MDLEKKKKNEDTERERERQLYVHPKKSLDCMRKKGEEEFVDQNNQG